MQTPPQKITLITGATSGIGLAASKGLVGEGHLVIGVGRSEEKVDAAQQSILTKHPDADIHYLLADLSSQTQIHKLAKEVRAYLNTRNLDHIDVLVNNAGAVSSWFTLTEDGYELQFAVNHLAPFLLTHELLPSVGEIRTGKNPHHQFRIASQHPDPLERCHAPKTLQHPGRL